MRASGSNRAAASLHRAAGVLGAAGCAAILALVPAGGARSAGVTVLHVFAASSLGETFEEIGSEFERAHPGARVRINLAGSQQLASQIEHGAAADVFAPADPAWIKYLAKRERIEGEPVAFARNRLVVIVPNANPARIGRLQDLARTGVKVVLGAEAVPVGKYSREALRNLSRADGFDGGFARHVLANVVSEEENVKSVVGKVQLGEADAGVCYRSDVTPAVSRHVRVLSIPDSVNVLATYRIAVLRGTRRAALAREFVALVVSPRGQRVLERHGLIPVAASAP